jgi:hypothetical protein
MGKSQYRKQIKNVEDGFGDRAQARVASDQSKR